MNPYREGRSMFGAITDCLQFAERRLTDLKAMGDAGISAKKLQRQQLNSAGWQLEQFLV